MLNFSLYFSNIQHSHIKNLLDRSTLEKVISDRRFLVSKLIGAWCRLIRGKRVVKGRWTEEKEARSQMTGWLFNLAVLYIFFCPGNLDEKSRAQRWSMDTHGGEKGIYIYILDALSGRNAATDLHQGNHDDTSYDGKSLYTHGWDTDLQGFGRIHTYNWAPSDELFHRPRSRGFSWGAGSKNQDWLN